ncbi:putative Protein tipD [Paratrimastix pyriformis]|uniref:Autophagy-related protein 16 domain-containing protein n=1 Tax=Paratrimastix pyriformis TaxID=342808 RepID=A0ABQ8UU22_9EUKA|nr:putative Protein tipD [Paratrimastix pyriformis]
MADWEQRILNQVTKRVAMTESLRGFVDKYTANLQALVRFREQASEVPTLRATSVALQARLETLQSNPESNALVKAKLEEAEKQREEVRTEVTGLYREKANLAQRTLDLSQQLDQTRKESAERLQAKEQLEKTNHDLEVQLGVMKEHHSQLQVELVKADETIRQLRSENQRAITELLAAKSREAEQMNMAKDLYDSLMRRMRKETAHEGEVNAIAFNMTGNQIVTASSDRKVKVWDVETGATVVTLTGCDKGASTCCFSDNGEFVMAGSADNATRVWHVGRARVVQCLTGHSNKITAAEYMRERAGAVTGSKDRTIKVWDLNKGFCQRTIFCPSSCHSLITSNASMVFSGHFDGPDLRIWDIRTDMGSGDPIQDIELQPQVITGLTQSADGTMLMAVTRDNSIKLLDTRTFAVTRTLRHERFHVTLEWCRGAFSPDGQYCACGSMDGSVLVWNTLTGAVERILDERAHRGPVACCAWSPIGETLASCDKERMVVTWK